MKLPPFGKDLVAARRRGVAINLFLHVGDQSWRRAQSRKPPHVLCVPPDQSWREFDWKCCAGLHVTLVAWNWPAASVDEFARHLVQQGARLVAALGASVIEDGKVRTVATTFYKPVRRQVAA